MGRAAPSEKILVETRIETVYNTETVYLEVPKIAEKIVTANTVSVLGTASKITGANLYTRLNYWIVQTGEKSGEMLATVKLG